MIKLRIVNWLVRYWLWQYFDCLGGGRRMRPRPGFAASFTTLGCMASMALSAGVQEKKGKDPAFSFSLQEAKQRAGQINGLAYCPL